MGIGDYGKAVSLLEKLKETDFIEPWMYSVDDVVNGKTNEYKKVAKDRYARMKNAVIVLYKPGTTYVEEKTNRYTYFEVKVDKDKYALYCGDHVKNYLLSIATFEVPYRYNEKWALKHEFIFKDQRLIETVCQELIDKYEEILHLSHHDLPVSTDV